MINRIWGRRFDIVVNGNVTENFYRPGDLVVETKNIALSKCDGGICSLQLVRDPFSQFPPLVNAIEAFTEIEFLQSETNPDDVAAMKNIQATYGLSSINWQGDPCVPLLFCWDGLNCSYYTDLSTPPRIISLDLSSRGLSGMIVPDFHYLSQLQKLDLSNNDLTGGVPEFLAHMKSLLVLDLSGNNLYGSVPISLRHRKNEGLQLNVDGNPKLCQSDPCQIPGGSHGSRSRLLVPVIVFAFMAVIIIVLVLIFVIRKKRPSSMRALSLSPTNPSMETKKRRFTYSEIRAMTNNFQRAVGEGGFGIVYHGYLNDTEQIATKVLSMSSVQGYKQFKAEVELLRRVHHTNLVSLVGYCDERGHLALIYEYMANGNLKEHLSGKRGDCVLNWSSRLRIAVGAAQGLEYLHSGCKPPMIHRDVKSVNILLDEKFQAKLADFGLSRSFSVGVESHVSTIVAGTPGYLDPEYYKTNWLTEKSDVYSFGIVLLEIITNQPVIEQTRERPHIPDWVELMLERGDIKTIVDPRLDDDYDFGSLCKAVELAISCVNTSSVARPNMSHVVHQLKDCLKSDNLRIGASQDMDSMSSLELSDP